MSQETSSDNHSKGACAVLTYVMNCLRLSALLSTFAVLFCIANIPAHAQDNYEIQVYGSETVPPRTTMLELHSNFVFQGSKTTQDGVFPTQHELHETIEITQGWTPWFETGFYIFTSVQTLGPEQGYWWVGDHIRPRVRAPEEWHLCGIGSWGLQGGSV